MGERGCAWASLWLEHAPSIGHAIGPRQTPIKILKIIKHKISGLFYDGKVFGIRDA